LGWAPIAAELIGRVTLDREGNREIRPELGMELTYNRLASEQDYAEDTGPSMMPVALSNANVCCFRTARSFRQRDRETDLLIGRRRGKTVDLSRLRIKAACRMSGMLSRSAGDTSGGTEVGPATILPIFGL